MGTQEKKKKTNGSIYPTVASLPAFSLLLILRALPPPRGKGRALSLGNERRTEVARGTRHIQSGRRRARWQAGASGALEFNLFEAPKKAKFGQGWCVGDLVYVRCVGGLGRPLPEHCSSVEGKAGSRASSFWIPVRGPARPPQFGKGLAALEPFASPSAPPRPSPRSIPGQAGRIDKSWGRDRAGRLTTPRPLSAQPIQQQPTPALGRLDPPTVAGMGSRTTRGTPGAGAGEQMARCPRRHAELAFGSRSRPLSVGTGRYRRSNPGRSRRGRRPTCWPAGAEGTRVAALRPARQKQRPSGKDRVAAYAYCLGRTIAGLRLLGPESPLPDT